MTKTESKETQSAQDSATESTTPVADAPSIVKPLKPIDVVTRVTGMGVPLAESIVRNMTDAEKAGLVESYTNGKDPRGTLQRIRDRIADDAIKTKSSAKPTS